jgi:hypothetical protein
VVASGVLFFALGSARGQTVDAPAATASDAGGPLEDASPPGDLPDAAAAAPAAPPEIVLTTPQTDVVEAPSPAPEAAPSFGRRGQVVILGGSDLGLSSSTFDGSSATRASYFFDPSIAYFVAKNVSVGLSGTASYGDSRGYGADSSLVDTRTTTVSAGPMFGLNVPMGTRFSWYPQLTIGFEWTRQTEELIAGSSLSIAGSALGYPETTQFGPFVELYAPFLLHATDHFFFGFGPGFFHDFGSVSGGPNIGGQRTEIYAGFVVGGYWGGATAQATAPAVAISPEPRFGDAGQFVFTNDLVVSVRSTTYAGTGSAERTTQISGSASYFVVDHVSLGLAVGFAGNFGKGIDATSGGTVTYSNASFSFGPRVGANISMGRAFSLYPQFTLGIQHEAYDELAASSENHAAIDVVSVDLFVPLLVHPAPHVFLGLGPHLYHELSSSVTFPNDPLVPATQNRETTVGAAFVLGGWL